MIFLIFLLQYSCELIVLDGKGVGKDIHRFSVSCVFSDGASEPLSYLVKNEFVLFSPLDACSPLKEKIVTNKKNNKEDRFIVLVFLGRCILKKKIKNIEKNKNISGVIFVSDNNTEKKDKICFVGCELLFPSFLIKKKDGEKLLNILRKKQEKGKYAVAIMKYNTKNSVSIIKQILLSLCVALFFFFVLSLIGKLKSFFQNKEHFENKKLLNGLILFKKHRYQKEEEEFKEICVICLNDFETGDQLTKIECGHVFHSLCVKTVILGPEKECPICREKI